MPKVITIPALLALVCLLAVLPPLPAAASAGEIAVTPLLPENQRKGVSGYFNLKVAPGQRQDLVLTVENRSQEDAALYVRTITPATAADGMIDYGADGPANPSLPHPFTELASAPARQMTLPPGGSQDITVALRIPAQPFEGCILGSILITREPADGQGVRHASAVAVLLSESDEMPPPNFILDNPSRQEEKGKAAVVVPVRNTMPALATGVAVTARVVDTATGALRAERSFPDVEMAPNGLFPLTVPLPGGALESGEYAVQVEITYGEHSWQLGEAFSVTEEAPPLPPPPPANEAKGERKALSRPALAGIGAAALAGLGVLAGILLRRHRENEDYLREMEQKIARQLQELEELSGGEK